MNDSNQVNPQQGRADNIAIRSSLSDVLAAAPETLFAEHSDARRLFHGRGQLYAGLEFLTVDLFYPILWCVLYKEPEQELWDLLKAELVAFAESKQLCCMIQYRYEKSAPSECAYGSLPSKTVAWESGLQYELILGRSQNIGYFMDFKTGRDWLAERVAGKRVLNLFSYTCATSVSAIAKGAAKVVNVDMSRSAMRQGEANHAINGFGDCIGRRSPKEQAATAEPGSGDVVMLAYDLFRSWKNIRKQGPYDIVIIDPPSRQRGSFEAEKDYHRVLRQIPSLAAEEGADVLACLNAPYLGDDFLKDLMLKEIPAAEFCGRVKNREDFPEKQLDCTLKMLHFKVKGQPARR